MTIEFRSPYPEEEGALRALFTEAFGDEAFTELFFSVGYAPERCLVAVDGGILAAQHWFECTLEGKKAAYLYGIAAFRAHRGRGVGTALIRAGIQRLRQQGYEAILLVPAQERLFSYYERFGFRQVSTIREERVKAGSPLPVRRLTAAEYAARRRCLLPEAALIQEGPCLALLAGYAGFYATEKTLAAVTENMVWELLGDPGEAPGLLAGLGLAEAAVRTPGRGRPFAMGLGTGGPIYLGLALD